LQCHKGVKDFSFFEAEYFFFSRRFVPLFALSFYKLPAFKRLEAYKKDAAAIGAMLVFFLFQNTIKNSANHVYLENN